MNFFCNFLKNRVIIIPKGVEKMNRLKELRQERKKTQEQLADEVGVTKRTYIYWEKGERQIKPDKAQKLADYFGVSVGYLLGYQDNFDYVSKKVIQSLDKVKDQASSQGIANYEDLERIAEADRIIKEFLKDTDKFKRYQESFPLKLSLAIQELIDLDNIKQTDYAKLLINYQVLEKSDQIKIFELITTLADKSIKIAIADKEKWDET